MWGPVAEPDWKLLRRLAPAALDRFCRQTLAELVHLAADGPGTAHEQYLAVFARLHDRDAELAATFDGLRRSTAVVQLAGMRRLGLVTDEEFAGFGPETRAAVAAVLDVRAG